MPTYQLRNPEMVALLAADFQARYEPQFALSNALSLFSMLPGLRGFWPLSSADETGAAYDLSGQSRTLTYNGNPAYNVSGLAPYIEFDGTGDYLSRADEAGLDIIGTETTIAAALRGVTVGGWFWIDSLAPGFNDCFISKWNTAGVDERSYLLYFDDALNAPTFGISSNGTLAGVSNVTGGAITAAAWHHIVGRFAPLALSIFVDGVETNAVTVAASLHSGAADLNLGAHDNGTAGLLDGRASLCFLSAAALPDAVVNQLYEQTRALFGA